MALSKKIVFKNGVETNYHIIAMVDSSAEFNKTTVYIHSFTSKELYKKSKNKFTLLKEQNELVNQFEELANVEERTKTQQNKLDKIKDKINEYADKINESGEYDNFIAEETIIDIPYQEDLSNENIQKVLIKYSELFKSANLVA